MNHRAIRTEETVLVKHMLSLAGENIEGYSIAKLVDEYEGGVLGSINFTLTDSSNYAGDIIRVDYVDEDGKRMEISLTQNHKGELLDLDFWKEDMSRLIKYPRPDQVTINKRGIY